MDKQETKIHSLNRQSLTLSKMNDWKITLKIFGVLGVSFLLFSQLSIDLRKNFSVITYPVTSYSFNKAKSDLGEISLSASVVEKEKSFLLSERIIDSGGLISPKYLSSFGESDGGDLIRKNFTLYLNGGFEVADSNQEDNKTSEVIGLVNNLANLERRNGNGVSNIFIGTSQDHIGDEKENVFYLSHPMLVNSKGQLVNESCLVKQKNKTRSIKTIGLCARKGHFLALRTFLLEKLDKDISFPLQIKNQIVYLKKFNANGGYTLGYTEFLNFLQKIKVSDLFYQKGGAFYGLGSPVDKLNQAFKQISLFNLVYGDIFKLYDTSKDLPFEEQVLSSIGFQFSEYLPKIFRITTGKITPKEETKKEGEEKAIEKKQSETKKQERYELTEDGIMVLEVGENEKNNLNFELVNTLFENLIPTSYAFYSDLFFGGSFSNISNDTGKNLGCVLNMADGGMVQYETFRCAMIKGILNLGTETASSDEGGNAYVNKAKDAFENVVTNTNEYSHLRGVDFNIPMIGFLGLNKDRIGFWIKGIEIKNKKANLVVKHFSFNFAGPGYENDTQGGKDMMKAGSITIQILYFILYFTLYFVFIACLSLMISSIYNYWVEKKDGL